MGTELLVNPEEVVEQTWTAIADFDEEFDKQGGALITPEMEVKWNEWFGSVEGQRVYREVGERILTALNEVANCFDPTHDRHHVLMVDAASLRQLIEEEIGESDWRRAQVIGAMAHDFGRVLEFKLLMQLSGQQLPTHGYLSYLALREILDGVGLPEDLLRQIYYSVAYHTGLAEKSAGWDLGNYLGAAVQRADREQLLNLELVAKSVSFEVITRNYALVRRADEASKYFSVSIGRVTGNDFWQWLECFTRNIELLAGKEAKNHENEYRLWQMVLLWLGQTDEQRAVTFAPEIAASEGKVVGDLPAPGKYWKRKEAIDLNLWRQMQVMVTDEQFVADLEAERAGRSWQELTLVVLREPQMYMTAAIEEQVLAALEKLPQLAQENWARAMVWTLMTRRWDDEARRQIMQEVRKKFPVGSLEVGLAQVISEQLA